MSAKITFRERDGITIVDSQGRITLFEGGAESLRDAIRSLREQGKKNIILNLAETSYVDSSGIGTMVSGFTNLANDGGGMKLLSLTKRVKDLLQITKLYNVFEVFDDEEAAVRSFR